MGSPPPTFARLNVPPHSSPVAKSTRPAADRFSLLYVFFASGKKFGGAVARRRSLLNTGSPMIGSGSDRMTCASWLRAIYYLALLCAGLRPFRTHRIRGRRRLHSPAGRGTSVARRRSLLQFWRTGHGEFVEPPHDNPFCRLCDMRRRRLSGCAVELHGDLSDRLRFQQIGKARFGHGSLLGRSVDDGDRRVAFP